MAGSGPRAGPQQRGIETSNLTPGVNLDTGSAEGWNAIRQVGKRFDSVVDDVLTAKAIEAGTKEGADIAAGKREYKANPLLAFTDVGQARAAAVQTAYLAGMKTDVDARDAQLRRDHAFDPQGYEKASAAAVSGFIQGAPPKFAVAVEQYAKQRAASGYTSVADARLRKDQAESAATITARETQLTADLKDLAAVPGGEQTPDFLLKVRELDDLNTEKAANPLFNWTPEQAALKRENVFDEVTGVVVSRDVAAGYAEGGKGHPGYAEGLRKLSAMAESPDSPLAGLDPAKKLRYVKQAKANLDAIYAGDREQQRLIDEQEREARAEQREKVGEFRLGIMTGGVSRAEILNSDLDDGQKASLLASADAAARRDRAEARSAASQDRLARSVSYREFSDGAAAGTLSSAEIADARGAGLLSAGQARTLAAKRDKVLKPIVDDVMAPFADQARQPGMTIRGTAALRAKAEEEATNWARMNPDAPLEERLKVGGLVAKKYFGQGGTPGPKGDAKGGAARSKSTRLQDLNQLKGKIPDAEFRTRRKAIIDGAP